MPNYVINKISLSGPEEEIKKALDTLRSKENENEIDFNNVIKMPESLNIPASSLAEDFMAAYLKTLDDKEKLSIAEKLGRIPVRFDGNYLKKYHDAFISGLDENRRKRIEDDFKRNYDEYKAANPSSIEDVGKAYIENIINYGADTWYDWRITHWGTKWGPSSIDFDDDYISFDTAWSAPIFVFLKLSEMIPAVTFSHIYADEDIGSNCGKIEYKAGEIESEYLPEGEEATRFACGIWGFDVTDYGFLPNGVEAMTLEEVIEPYNLELKIDGNEVVLIDNGKPGSSYDGARFDIGEKVISNILDVIQDLTDEDYKEFCDDLSKKGFDPNKHSLEGLLCTVPTDIVNYGLMYNFCYCDEIMSIKALEKKSLENVISNATKVSENTEPNVTQKEDTKEL